MAKVSIVIPTLNEEKCLAQTLGTLMKCDDCEFIVVDGGSEDKTLSIAEAAGVTILISPPGRGQQMAAGAEEARGEVLWFLHADTIPSATALSSIETALDETSVAGGTFRVSFDGRTKGAKFLTWLYPWLAFLGLSYGDSSIFVRRSVYAAAGGFNAFPIFEDLDLIRRIRKEGRWVRLDDTVFTSSRRFEGRNFGLIFARWTILQIMFWLGVSPKILGSFYVPIREAKSV